jgi:holliday junction DNA helicase RuvA
VPRVGRKTAERLVVELGDKLDEIAAEVEPSAVTIAPATDDAVRALVSLGYSPAEAERGVRAALETSGGASVPNLIKDALAELAGR